MKILSCAFNMDTACVRRPLAYGIMSQKILRVCAAYVLNAWMHTSLPENILSAA